LLDEQRYLLYPAPMKIVVAPRSLWVQTLLPQAPMVIYSLEPDQLLLY
jgi:hypothetical protein